MYFLDNGGIVIDNPGVREVGLIDSNKQVGSAFDEILEYSENCKYADCTHTHEPGCAVIDAVKCGELDEDKYNNYLNLKKETEYNNMSDFEKRVDDKKFGKFIKKTKKELEDFWG
jgi:ribosome biogenesis GTPase